MAITARCPGCGASYNLRDEMVGKSVRCKKCEEMFKVGATAAPTRAKGSTEIQAKAAKGSNGVRNGSNGPSAKAPATKKTILRRPDDDEEDQPPRGSRAAAKPSKAASRHDDEEEDDQPPRGSRAAVKPSKAASRRDDDEEEEERPRKGKKAAKQGSGNKVLLIVGGILCVLFLMCGGAAFGVYYFVYRVTDAAVTAVGDLDKEFAKAAEEMKKNGNIPPPDFKVPPGFPVPPDVKNPPNFPVFTPPTEIKTIDDALRDLKTTDNSKRQNAARWLQTAPVDPSRQTDVAKALGAVLEDKGGGATAGALHALKTWASKDNVPDLVKVLAATTPGVQVPDYIKGSLETLGKLKDERGAAAIARFMPEFWTREPATKGLEAMGPVAEKEVLKLYHHSDGGTRDAARKLIVAYNTQQPAILKQTVEDLKVSDQPRRGTALEWLGKASVDPALQADVARALEGVLSSSDSNQARTAMNALVLWATKESVPAILPQLQSPDNGMRHAAMQVLGQLKDERAVAPVAEKLVPGTDRQQASKALVAMGKIVETEVRDKYLTHQDRAVSNEAANILKAIGSDGNIGLEQALAGLAAPDAGRRRSSADTLQKTAVDPKQRAEVAKALIKCLSDTDNGVAHSAAKALTTWADKTDVAQLLPAVGSPNANVRHFVMDILGKLKDPQAVPPIVARLMDGGDRKAASNALKAMGPIIQQPALYQALNSPDKHIKIEVCHILAVAGTRASLQTLNALGIWASQPIQPPRNRNPMHPDVLQAVQQAMQGCSTRQ